MDISLIMDGKATLEDLVELNHYKGLAFIIEDGKVTGVINE